MAHGAEAGRRVQLLGRFAAYEVGRSPLRLGPVGERLLAFIACRDSPVPREHVAAALWPDCPETRARANLRSTLHRLASRSPNFCVSTPHQLSLNQFVNVDLRKAKVASARILAGAPEEHDLDGTVRDLLTQDLLPDWYDIEWILEWREDYRQTRLHALERLCLTLAGRGRHGDAIVSGLAAVAAEPLRESAHRALIYAHLQESNYGEAVRQYERCRNLLRDELGVDPSPQLRRLLRSDARAVPMQPSGDRSALVVGSRFGAVDRLRG